MRILFVLEYYHPHVGGVEVLFRTLCEALVSRGHEVHVVTSRLVDTDQEETVNGVHLHRINVPRFASRYFFTFFSMPYILKIAKYFDIIHTTTYNAAPPAWLASLIRRKPSVITVHEVIGKDWGRLMGLSKISALFHRLMERIIISLPFDSIVAVSHSTRKNLKAAGVRKKINVVHNSVSHDVFNRRAYPGARKRIRKKLGVKDNEFLYAFYGRPGVSKGVEFLIKAMPRIRSLIPRSRALYIMASEPKERYKWMKKLLEENADGEAILHKSLPYNRLPEYLMAADCIVIPSITEGFGFCVAESCSLGKPVVATNTTSIPEVASGKFLLVPPKNPNAIAEALKLVKEKKYMKTPLKKFSEKSFVDGYEKVYSRMMSSH